MSKDDFNVDILSKKSIDRLIKKLESYKDGIEPNLHSAVEQLAEGGAETARSEVEGMQAVFTGELLESIYSQDVSETSDKIAFEIVADSDHAAFVEFGTGIIGKESPYTGELPEGVQWDYASGHTIHQLKDGRYGWFYPADDGNWYFTQGMRSRPFMLNAANAMRDGLEEALLRTFRENH